MNQTSDPSFSKLNVAIVTDWMLAPGGADRMLLSLLKVFHKATVYTSIYTKENYSTDFAINTRVKSTFLQRMPFSHRFHRHYNILAPLAFESLDLSQHDLVVSLSAGPAKGIIPQTYQKHIGIILTPPRYLWEKSLNSRGSRLKKAYRLISPLVSHFLRIWDQTAMTRVDNIVSISDFIQKKVKKVYHRESEVIYPPVSSYWFAKQKDIQRLKIELPRKYFLVVSRLYDYKKVDWAIEACKSTNIPLLIVGSGPDEKYLRKVTGKNENIRFLGRQSDAAIKQLYSSAEALLFCGVEDFGLVMVEAMASGCPVLAYGEGGAEEIVEVGLTGSLFESQEQLNEMIRKFDRSVYNSELIKKSAERFSEERFVQKFTNYLQSLGLS